MKRKAVPAPKIGAEIKVGTHIGKVIARIETMVILMFENKCITSGVYIEDFWRGNVVIPSYPINEKYMDRIGKQVSIKQKIKKGDVYKIVEQLATCINFRSPTDIDAMFDDGYVSESKTWGNFVRGHIANPSHWKKEEVEGATAIASNGLWMKVIDASKGLNNLTIQFSDGVVVYGKRWQHFQSGHIAHPTKKAPRTKSLNFEHEYRVKQIEENAALWEGQTFLSHRGQIMMISKYRGSNDVDVTFDDGYVAMHVKLQSVQQGNVYNPCWKAAA